VRTFYFYRSQRYYISYYFLGFDNNLFFVVFVCFFWVFTFFSCPNSYFVLVFENEMNFAHLLNSDQNNVLDFQVLSNKNDGKVSASQENPSLLVPKKINEQFFSDPSLPKNRNQQSPNLSLANNQQNILFCELSPSELLQISHSFPPCTQSNIQIPCKRGFDCELDETDIASHPKITLNPPLPSIPALFHDPTNSFSTLRQSQLTLPPIAHPIDSPFFGPSPLLPPSSSPPQLSTITSKQNQSQRRLQKSNHQFSHEISRFPLANVKHKNWDEQDMLRAMKLVRTTNISARAAAERCHVPRSTLWDRLNKLKIAAGEKKKSKK
jgi:predicted DNA-binding protein (UPF0251 family)